jgi:hypothetical protein
MNGRYVRNASIVLVLCVGLAWARQRGSRRDLADQQAFAATVVGIYELAPRPGQTSTLPPPRVGLLPDGTFDMASIPAEWVDGYAGPSEKAFSAQGRWTVGDDGDGSWEIVCDVTRVSGISTSKRLRMRPFDQPKPGLILDGPGAQNVNLFRTTP